MEIKNLFITNLLKDIFSLPIWLYHYYFGKRDPKTWVFGAWFGTSYSDNAKAVYEYVLENNPDINAFWITTNPDVFQMLKSAKKPVVMKGTKESRIVCSKAGYVFITQTASELDLLYIGGAKQVWLWHGMPLKKIGDDFKQKENLKNKIHKLFPQNHFNRPDWFISISHKWDEILKSAYPIKDVIITGLPRTDSFFDKSTTPFIQQINKTFHNPLKILYMPTFRDPQYNNKIPFNPFTMFGFSMDKFNSCLHSNNAVFMYKGHFCDLQYKTEYPQNENRFIVLKDSMYSDLYSLIKDADILMTDYSGVYFDFLLLNKPIILTPFDKDEYCSTSREMYFDYEKEIEGVKANNWDEVIKILNEKHYFIPSKETICKFNEYQDGNSTKRVVDHIRHLIQ